LIPSVGGVKLLVALLLFHPALGPSLMGSPLRHRILASLILPCAIFMFAPAQASAVTIAWSPVGNPGNAADPATGSLYGAVPYTYNIGTYDVTNSQYVAFLNSNDSSGANPLGLYNGNMSFAPYGGINYNSGAANGSKYSVISGNGNHPIGESLNQRPRSHPAAREKPRRGWRGRRSLAPAVCGRG
jgi:hypothetical protein